MIQWVTFLLQAIGNLTNYSYVTMKQWHHFITFNSQAGDFSPEWFQQQKPLAKKRKAGSASSLTWKGKWQEACEACDRRACKENEEQNKVVQQAFSFVDDFEPRSIRFHFFQAPDYSSLFPPNFVLENICLFDLCGRGFLHIPWRLGKLKRLRRRRRRSFPRVCLTFCLPLILSLS